MDKIPVHKNKIVIVGNSNVGKSSLFNHLTKDYSIVANYPYTTVGVARGDTTLGGEHFELIDTPGIYSLEIQSEDEIVTRDILIKEHPEYIVQCIDAALLKTSLLLTSHLLELNIPLIICLNNVDGAMQQGIWVDGTKLSQLLGVPVIETMATEGKGVSELRRSILTTQPPADGFKHREHIERDLAKLSGYFPVDTMPSPAVLLLLLLEDKDIETWTRKQYGESIYQDVKKLTHYAKTSLQTPLARIVFKERNEWVEHIVNTVSGRSEIISTRLLETCGALTRHPVYGWPILGAIIYATYLLVGKVGAVFLVDSINAYLFDPLITVVGNSIPWEFWRDFAVGDYGILTMGLANALGTVLPILALFFLILNTLEDTGYLPNLCILSNRFFQKIGLSGKSVLPIILGFGCKTVATLATKILDSRKERYIAIFLIAFAIPCSAQLGVNIAVLAYFPVSAFLLVFCVLALVEIMAGLLLNKIIKQEAITDFILEIPPIRLPNVKNLLIKTYYRLKWFLIEAVPLFIIGALVLFTMDKLRILHVVERMLSPLVVSFLGLPIKCVEAFLLCIARHEAGAVILMQLVKTGQLDYVQACVSIIIVTCFVPCFANLMAMIKELGMKSALVMAGIIIVSSIFIGGAVNYLMRFLL
jgi:ferrous iron transport protein B